MTKLKDRLSASVRMAKAAQQSPADPPASEPAAPSSAAEKPADKAAAARAAAARPAAAKPASRRPKSTVAPSGTPAGDTSGSGEIPESGSTLFPARVWPD